MAFEVIVKQADRERALCFDVLPDDEIDRAVFDHFDVALGDVVNDDVQRRGLRRVQRGKRPPVPRRSDRCRAARCPTEWRA